MANDKDSLYRTELERMHNKVWDTCELQADYDVLGFSAGFAIVRDRKTGKKGTLAFTHMLRFYFSFCEMEE